MSTAAKRWLARMARRLFGLGASTDPARPQGVRRHRNRLTLCLEPLEDRLTPASWAVSTLDDIRAFAPLLGPWTDRNRTTISLRSAIEAGNRSQDTSIRIDIPTSLTGTITLGGALGALEPLNRNFTINGPGFDKVAVVRDPMAQPFRIFTIAAGKNCYIRGLEVAQGRVTDRGGGAIYNGGSLVLADMSLHDNNAVFGGAIYNDGTLEVYSSYLYSNGATRLWGGAIANNGEAWIRESTQIFVNSSATTGGGIENGDGRTLHLWEGTQVYGNSARYGGGIANFGTLDMQGGLLQGNSATEDGGGLYSESDGTATLTNVTISGLNEARYGGGVYVQAGTTLLDNCTLQGNRVRPGSGGARPDGAYRRPTGTLRTNGGDVNYGPDPRAPQNMGALNTGINSGSLVLATFTDDNPNAVPSDFLASVAWGDGNTDTSADGNGIVSVIQNEDGSFSVIADHTYAAADTYGITVTVNDTEVNSLTATVTDPVLNASGGTFSGTAGNMADSQVLATFTSTNAEAVAADFSASVDWGDGASNDSGDDTSTVSIVQNEDGSFSVLGKHTYTQAGSCGIGVSLSDSDGNTTGASLTASISAATLGASAGSFSAKEGLNPGSQVLATFTSTNPYAAVGDFLAIVTWGDDSDDAGPISIVQNEDGSFSVVGEHLYAEAGLYTLKVIVSDADGSTTDVSFTAAVSDAALTPTASSFSATEGVDPGSQTLATFIDDNPNPTLSDFSVLVKWGDGTTNASGDETGTVTIVQNEDGSFSIAGDHIYATAGSYDITVTITDVGGSSAFVVFTAQVKSS